MAVRRPELKPTDNAERWLVSYADFMTLLFGFFLVMYAISSVNEARYETLSRALEGVFDVEDRRVDPVQVGEPVQAPGQDPVVVEHPRDEVPDAASAEADSVLEQMADAMSNQLSGLVDNNSLAIKGNQHWLEIAVDSEVLFRSGSAEPVAGARNVLAQLAQVLVASNNPVTVEGYTDNRPIRTARFPSNWELSSARAAAVVRLLVDAGLAGHRLAAVGYGPHNPIASNRTEEGRRKNRRVVLVVSRNQAVQRAVAANGEAPVADTLADLAGGAAPAAPAPVADAPATGEPAFRWLTEEDAGELPPRGDTVRAVRLERGGVLFTNGAGN